MSSSFNDHDSHRLFAVWSVELVCDSVFCLQTGFMIQGFVGVPNELDGKPVFCGNLCFGVTSVFGDRRLNLRAVLRNRVMQLLQLRLSKDWIRQPAVHSG